jgi:hypothetical protein
MWAFTNRPIGEKKGKNNKKKLERNFYSFSDEHCFNSFSIQSGSAKEETRLSTAKRENKEVRKEVFCHFFGPCPSSTATRPRFVLEHSFSSL